MPLYRFYRIVSDIGPEEYIGSTRSPLHKRFWEHRNRYEKGLLQCSSKAIFDKYGMSSCSIILIHEMECETREEALREERRIYDERRVTTINERRPYVSPDEKKVELSIRNKEYQKANLDKFREANKRYREANRDKIRERNKARSKTEQYKEYQTKYREANREKMRDYMRSWYAKQKEHPASHTTSSSQE